VYDCKQQKNVYANKPLTNLQYSNGSENFELLDYHRLLNFVHPEDRQELKEVRSQYNDKESGNNWDYTLRVKGKNGLYKNYIIWESVFETNEAGEPSQILGVAIDITEMKRVERDLIKTNEEKNTILSIVAHDLRSPINSILGILKIIDLAYASADDELKELAENIRLSCNRGIEIIHELLDVQALREEKNQVQEAPWLIGRRAKAILNNYQTDAEERDLKLHFEDNTGETYVDFSKSYFGRILDNLISNALKFTPIMGNVYLSLDKKKGEVHLTLKDTGMGIPEDMINVLFKRFSDARRNGLRGERSVGLGMSIVKELIRIIGGTIRVESEVNKGTTFYLTFPIADVHETKNTLTRFTLDQLSQERN
jgi:two-component system sensor histidine kinase VicK